MPKLGENVRRTREERGLQGKELAQLVNITPGYLSQIETGKSEPTLKVLRRIASALGVTPGTLLDGEPTMRGVAEMLEHLDQERLTQAVRYIKYLWKEQIDAFTEYAATLDVSVFRTTPAEIEYLWESHPVRQKYTHTSRMWVISSDRGEAGESLSPLLFQIP